MIKVENLSFSYGEKPLYERVNFVVAKGQKVGLVGTNGSGKTTLLKIITGSEDGYKGKVLVYGKVALVPQEVKHDPLMERANSVLEYITEENSYPKYAVSKIFTGLELDIKLTENPKKLSGGQKTKLALARALLSKPEILLLDEPTNFMDYAGKKFVMDFLTNYPGTVIVISHDLDLMDKAIDKVLFVNTQTKIIEEYKGTYKKAMKLKTEKEEFLKRKVIAEKKHIKRMEAGVERLKKNTSKKGVRQRVILQRRIERLKGALPELPKEVAKIKINLPEPAKVGELPVRTINIEKSYGELKVLKNVNFTIVRGEKIALIGPNGVGKSTFIKILMDRLEPDAGEVVRNPSLKVGYYSQEFENFDFAKSVIETFCEYTKREEGFARSFLGRYMFLGDKVFQMVGSLSGGEKTRLSIALITGVDNNLLVLDEPTTYLDTMSQRVILEALKQYRGTMIFVSHTADFVKELAPNKAYLFPEEKMVFWSDELLDKVEEL